MVDTISKSARSRVMRSIRSRGTKPEVLIRLALIRSRLKGWRMNILGLPGKPDFIFGDKKLAVFIDGCFWHGCKKCYRGPKSNKLYWASKLRLNKARDIRNAKMLLSLGWNTLRLWEHEVRGDINGCIESIRRKLKIKS